MVLRPRPPGEDVLVDWIASVDGEYSICVVTYSHEHNELFTIAKQTARGALKHEGQLWPHVEGGEAARIARKWPAEADGETALWATLTNSAWEGLTAVGIAGDKANRERALSLALYLTAATRRFDLHKKIGDATPGDDVAWYISAKNRNAGSEALRAVADASLRKFDALCLPMVGTLPKLESPAASPPPLARKLEPSSASPPPLAGWHDWAAGSVGNALEHKLEPSPPQKQIVKHAPSVAATPRSGSIIQGLLERHRGQDGDVKADGGVTQERSLVPKKEEPDAVMAAVEHPLVAQSMKVACQATEAAEHWQQEAREAYAQAREEHEVNEHLRNELLVMQQTEAQAAADAAHNSQEQNRLRQELLQDQQKLRRELAERALAALASQKHFEREESAADTLRLELQGCRSEVAEARERSDAAEAVVEDLRRKQEEQTQRMTVEVFAKGTLMREDHERDLLRVRDERERAVARVSAEATSETETAQRLRGELTGTAIQNRKLEQQLQKLRQQLEASAAAAGQAVAAGHASRLVAERARTAPHPRVSDTEPSDGEGAARPAPRPAAVPAPPPSAVSRLPLPSPAASAVPRPPLPAPRRRLPQPVQKPQSS